MSIDLVTKCQLAAIGGLEKQVETMNSNLQARYDEARRAVTHIANSSPVFLVICMWLAQSHYTTPSYKYVLLLGVTTVVWLIPSLKVLSKVKTVHEMASAQRGQMNELRPSAVILQEEVDEDFRTNEGARDLRLYRSTSSRIAMLVLQMDHHQSLCTRVKWHGISSVVGFLAGCFMFARFWKLMLFQAAHVGVNDEI